MSDGARGPLRENWDACLKDACPGWFFGCLGVGSENCPVFRQKFLGEFPLDDEPDMQQGVFQFSYDEQR